jgi:hypothetical protein
VPDVTKITICSRIETSNNYIILLSKDNHIIYHITYMIKYYPYKSDKLNKKIYIIINDNKKVYFGKASASDFTFIKMSSANNCILIGTRIMKIGLNPELIALAFGPLVVMESTNNNFKLSGSLKKI